MDEGEEAGVEPVEAGCEASEVLELVEASFDAVARFVEVAVVRDDDFWVRLDGMIACIPASAIWARKALLS